MSAVTSHAHIPISPETIATTPESIPPPREPPSSTSSGHESHSIKATNISLDGARDDMRSVILSFECISEAMQRCSDTLLPVMLDSARIINHLNNPGLTKFQGIAVVIHGVLDRSCSSAIECSAVLHRIGTYMETTKPSIEDIKAFRTLIQGVLRDTNNASTRFQQLYDELIDLFSSSENFYPPSLELVPPANKEEDHHMHIVACIRSHVVFKRGKKGVEQFSTLEDILRQAEPFFKDLLEIHRWWQTSSNFAGELQAQILSDDLVENSTSFKNDVWFLYKHLQPWVSKTHIMISLQPQTRAWKATTELLTEVRRNNALPLADRTITLPPKDWKYKDAPKMTFAIIAKELYLAMGSQGNRRVDVEARLSACQYFPTDGTYGIRIKIQHREKLGLKNRRLLCRCTMMDISLSLCSKDSNNKKRAAIISMAPERNRYDKAEVKYTVKGTVKANPSAAGFRVGEASVEIGKEVTRPDHGVMMGSQTLNGDATWSLVENKSSKSGVVDCEIGIVFVPPSDEITLKLDIKAMYVVDLVLMVIPWTIRRPMNVDGSLHINLPEAVKQVPTLSTGQQAFLAPCSALVPKEV